MCRSRRVYASIDPETSQRITSGRRLVRRARRMSTAGSPCAARDFLKVARASSRDPSREERKRRLGRCPGDHCKRSRKRAAAARSAAVMAEKSVPRKSSVGLAITRTLRWTSDVIRLGTWPSGTSICPRSGFGRRALGICDDRLPPRRSDQKRSKAMSNGPRSACREMRAVRLAPRTSSGRSRSISAIAWR